METVENVVQTAANATESVQKGLRGIREDMDGIRNQQEQMLDRLGSLAVHESAPQNATTHEASFGAEPNQNIGEAPVLSMTPGAPTNLNQGLGQGTPAPDWDADWSAAWPESAWNIGAGQWPDVGEPPGLPPTLKKPPTMVAEHGKSAPSASTKEIPNARWKSLNDVPMFDPTEGSGTPWDLGLKLDVWKRQLMTLAGTVSNDFAEYVLLCFKHAQDRHDRQARGETLPVLEPVKGYPEEFESRLVIVLLKVLPDIIKTPALETDENRQGIGSLRLLEELYLRVRPGGLEEQQTLVKFLRNLSPVASAREAIDVLRHWRLAKNRVSALALPEIPAYEQVKGIMTLLRTLERKYDALKTRLALVHTSGHPTGQAKRCHTSSGHSGAGIAETLS